MPLMRCKSDNKSGWKYGEGGHCYTGPGAKKKAIRQGIAIQENGGPPFESRKKAKSQLNEEQIDKESSLFITKTEEKRDNLERELMDRALMLANPEK